MSATDGHRPGYLCCPLCHGSGSVGTEANELDRLRAAKEVICEMQPKDSEAIPYGAEWGLRVGWNTALAGAQGALGVVK